MVNGEWQSEVGDSEFQGNCVAAVSGPQFTACRLPFAAYRLPFTASPRHFGVLALGRMKRISPVPFVDVFEADVSS